jgi:hypothetical protein
LQSELVGLSGLIKFDHQGFRTDIELDLIEVTEVGLVKKGSWNSSLGITVIPPPPIETFIPEGEDLRNITFIVLIALVYDTD